MALALSLGLGQRHQLALEVGHHQQHRGADQQREQHDDAGQEEAVEAEQRQEHQQRPGIQHGGEQPARQEFADLLDLLHVLHQIGRAHV